MFRVYVYWSSSDKYQVFRIRFSHICKSSLYMHFGRYDCTLKTSVSCTPPHDIASDFSNCHPVFQLCLVDRQRQRQSRTEVQWRVHWPESLQRRRGLSHLHWWVSSVSSRAQPLTLVSLFSVVEGSVLLWWVSSASSRARLFTFTVYTDIRYIFVNANPRQKSIWCFLGIRVDFWRILTKRFFYIA